MLRISLLLFLLLCFLPGNTHAQYWTYHGILYGDSSYNVVDLDNDGDLDVVSCGINRGVRVSYNNLPDPWQEYECDIPVLWATSSCVADFDADGDQDLVYHAGGGPEGSMGWVEQVSCSQFVVHEIAEFGFSHGTISVGDVEGDGDIDIVSTMVPDGGYHGITTWTQQDNSTWTVTQFSDFGHRGLSRMIDIDGDGFLDFAATSDSSEDTLTGGLMVYFGTEDGLFEQHRLRWADVRVCREHQIVDFDGDGDLDVVTRHGFFSPFYYPTEITWWENLGMREFVGHTIFSTWNTDEYSAYRIAVLDAENDGDMDIVTSFHGNSIVSSKYCILLNQGDNETFISEQISDITVGQDFRNLSTADINNDGFTDIVNGSISWYKNPNVDTVVDNPMKPGLQDGPGHPSNHPSEFVLDAAYPNPFNAQTTVTVSLPSPAELNVTVYNVIGQPVATLADGSFSAGVHPLTWNTSSDGSSTLTSGLYFIHAAVKPGSEAPGHLSNQIQKVVLVR